MGAQQSSFINGHVANLSDIHKQLWLQEHFQVKGAGEKKKKVEKDACLNNLKLSPRRSAGEPPQAAAATRGSRTEPPQGGGDAGEDASRRPQDEEAALRRSRSLALVREDTFNSFEIPAAAGRQRRSQLIPRARLIDRNCFRDNRFITKGKSQENIYSEDNSQKKRKSNKPDINETSSKASSFPLCSEIDNFGPKSIDSSSVCQGTEKNYSYSEIGLSLPYYTTVSTCETDISPVVTEENLERKSSSEENLDSIPYDENIVLSKNTPLYDNIADYYSKSFKPKTIRGNPLVYSNNSETKSRSAQSVYDSDSTVSECLNQGPSEYIESDTNFDEIKLTNENIKFIHQDKITENIIYDSESSNIENNPIYDEITNTSHVKEIDKSQSEPDVTINDLTWTKKFKEPPIRTFVKVPPPDFCDDLTSTSEEYKTIVSIDTDDKLSSCFSSTNSIHEAKKHSHNYLKEFLESQRGSRKPLQNFLSKRISRAFGNPKVNLTDNQYHSLPDISLSKNIKKPEKPERKSRKTENKSRKSDCLKYDNNQQKASNDSTTNRFIVNIGKHFDVTALSNVPVDFELKISKISKSKSNKEDKKGKEGKEGNKEKKKLSEEDREKTFLDAVRTLKQTLGTTDDNQKVTKPEIVAVKTKHGINQEITNLSKRRSENLLKTVKQEENTKKAMEKTMEKPVTQNSVEEEYHEKVGTIRNYWDKVLLGNGGENTKTDQVNGENKCKIVEVKTKVDEVKKQFEESCDTNGNEIPSKVQLAKQIFEKSSKNDKNEKFSSYIKECKEIFENPYFEKEQQLESLNPNIVEIVENQNKLAEEKTDPPNPGNHIPVFKSKSVIEEPEFDHVRYRIMKSDVFQKKIYANCEKESQLEGLMQYLQDFSFHELLIDNNIVIIEPIRTNVKFEGKKKQKTARNVTPLVHAKKQQTENGKSSCLKRKFFYHPIRVNREVNDDELPNPDTVKQVRQLFEAGLIRSQSTKELDGTHSYKSDPDKDRCSTTETNSSASILSDYGSNENLFESIDDLYYDTQYVSEDILEKIRDHGTSITYYGGRILNKYNGKSDSLTKAIMDEIRKNQNLDDCDCKKHKTVTFIENSEKNDSSYQGMKFRLLKSNSCSSRLELVGTKNSGDHKTKFKQKELIDEANKNAQNDKGNFTEFAMITLKNNGSENLSAAQKDNINENIKSNGELPRNPTDDENKLSNRPKITSNNLQFDYDLQGVRRPPKNDMEFEPYEVADS